MVLRVRGVAAALVAQIALIVGLTAPGCGGGGGGSSASLATASGAVGSWAGRLVAGTEYSRLRVEIDYVSGLPPSTNALTVLQARLSERCNKPGGIEVVVDDVLTAGQSTAWSVAQTQTLEAQARDSFASGDTAVVHVLYLDGGTDRDTSSGSVLGYAYTGTSIAIMKQTCDATANRLVSPDEVEATVLVHELGHVLGLVNLGAPLQSAHEDSAHPGHDAASACVMFWQVETTDLRTIIMNSGSSPTQFDAACVADLQALGGK